MERDWDVYVYAYQWRRFIMNEEITIEYEGKEYSAEYYCDGDTVTVFLPNGQTRTTELRGLKPEAAARPHLMGYARLNT